jgi:hypothetical protein
MYLIKNQFYRLTYRIINNILYNEIYSVRTAVLSQTVLKESNLRDCSYPLDWLWSQVKQLMIY